MRRYSHFFSTIHDEAAPIGAIGRGSHYSVLRAIVWQPKLAFHDFVIVWDEDHDTRIIWIAEQLLAQGLLTPVLALGERKGAVTVLSSLQPSAKYAQQVNAITEGVPSDSFPADVAFFPQSVGGIIQGEDARATAYLSGIFALWQIGTKPPEFSEKEYRIAPTASAALGTGLLSQVAGKAPLPKR